MKTLLFLFTCQIAFAQFHGQISDAQTKENLVGVSVYISDLKRGINTNQTGEFVFENIKSGNYLIEISLIGYQTKVERVLIKNDFKLNIALEPAVKELAEIVVTGVSRSTELKLSPIIVKAINKNTLNQNSATNLIDALKNVPGVSQITTGAAISKPIIRGLGYNRVISLYDGIRQEGQQWGDEHGIEIDEYGINRIEIVKGPGSLMYGSDGIAGVLNFISPKAPILGEIKTQLNTNYQSNNNLMAYSVSNAGNKNGFQWQGRLTNKIAGNFQNKLDGKVLNSGFKELDGSIFLGINKNWGHSHWQINSFNNTINMPEGERNENGQFIFMNANGLEETASERDLKSYKIGFPHQSIQHLRILANNYLILNQGTINFDLGFQNNKRKEFGDITAPEDIDLFFDLNSINYNLRYNLNEKNGWETSIGLGGMQQQNTNKGLEFLIPAYHLFDIGSFIFSQKKINNKLNFAAGLRFDNRKIKGKELILDENQSPILTKNQTSTTKFEAFNKNYNGISASLGATYQLNAVSTLKANVSRGFRTPNVSELVSNGRHEGSFRYEYGNLKLKSEISHQFDLAYFLNSDHVSIEVSPFANLISNFIFTQKLSNALGQDSIPNAEDGAPAYLFVQGDAKLIGGEVLIDVHPHPLDWLHIENAFSFVQATQNNQPDSTRFLPFIPAPRYRGELKAELPNIGKKGSNIYLKIGFDYFFRQNQFYKANQTETATPAYTLLHAGMGANLKAFGQKDGISIFLNADNLMNVAYQSHLSRLKYAPINPATGQNGIFNIGRNFSLKTIFRF